MGYRATQNEDGTWTVHDVPIFAKTRKALGDGVAFEFDDAWLEGAVTKARQRQQFGYLGPLNIHHKSDPRGTRRVGYVLPKRVAPMTFSDGTLPVVFADYLRVEDEAFKAMQRGEFPYVSIESRDATKGEISACALLPDDVPHNKFPLFTIGEVVPSGTPARYTLAANEAGSALCFASSGVEFAALSRFKPMKRQLTSKVYDTAAREFVFTFNDKTTERRKTGGDFEFEEGATDAEPAKEPAKDGEGEKAAGLTVKELEAALKGMTLTLDEIGELRAILEAAAKAAGGEATEAAGEGEKKAPPKPSANPPEAQMSETALATAMEAKAETAAARAELAEIKAERARDAAIDAATKALEGHSLQDGELAAIFAEGGEKGLGIYVAARKKHGRRAPTTTVGGATVLEVEMADLPKDYEFSADPAVRAEEIKHSRHYDQASARTKQLMTRKRFIECNVKPASELAR